jgi:hypothetical protein
MVQDTSTYDATAERPLPKWLTDQRDSLNTFQPVRIEMKEDRSLNVSFAVTGAIILIVIAFLTVHLLRKKKKNTL